jgi:hypothetical protein
MLDFIPTEDVDFIKTVADATKRASEEDDGLITLVIRHQKLSSIPESWIALVANQLKK